MPRNLPALLPAHAADDAVLKGRFRLPPSTQDSGSCPNMLSILLTAQEIAGGCVGCSGCARDSTAQWQACRRLNAEELQGLSASEPQPCRLTGTDPQACLSACPRACLQSPPGCHPAGGLSMLHDAGIVHGDLSANNVLLSAAANSRRFTVAVSDFGLSHICADAANGKQTETVGTVGRGAASAVAASAWP